MCKLTKGTISIKATYICFVMFIDPMQKWLPLNYSFVHIQNSLTMLTAYIISASRVFVQSLKFHRASTPEGGRDASRALHINSRVLPQSLSFCRRSGVGSFWHPALLPWRWLTEPLPFLAAYHSCRSSRGLLP